VSGPWRRDATCIAWAAARRLPVTGKSSA
jgi:hypothetical protein